MKLRGFVSLLARRWRVLLLLGAVLFLSANIVRTLTAGSPALARPEDAAAAARTVGDGGEPALARPRGSYVAGNGVVEPASRETRLAPAVAGRVATVLVHEGEFVEAGTELVRLDTAVEEATLAALEADERAAQAELARLLRGSRAEDIAASVAEASAAAARAELSRGVLGRFERLGARGAAAEEEIERARREAEAAEFVSQEAAARRAAVLRGSRREEIQAADARVAAARARTDGARAAVEQRVLRAPNAGEVLQIKYRVGELYQPGGEPIIVLGDTRTLRVRMDVDERDVGRIRGATKALVRAPAYPERQFVGRIVEIGRRMGRKNLRTDDPRERIDTKVLELVLEVAPDEHAPLIVGQRVVCYVELPDDARDSTRTRDLQRR